MDVRRTEGQFSDTPTWPPPSRPRPPCCPTRTRRPSGRVRCLAETAGTPRNSSPRRPGTAGAVRRHGRADLGRRRDAAGAGPARRTGPPAAEPFLLGTATAVAQWADELDEADRLVDRGLAGQRPDLLHPMHAALLNTRADIAAARGDRPRCLPPTPPAPPALQRARPRADRPRGAGRTDEAQRLADGFDLREAPDNWELNRFLYARGVLRAAAGDPAGAPDFLECGSRRRPATWSARSSPRGAAAAECRLALQASRRRSPWRRRSCAWPGCGTPPHGRPVSQGARPRTSPAAAGGCAWPKRPWDSSRTPRSPRRQGADGRRAARPGPAGSSPPPGNALIGPGSACEGAALTANAWARSGCGRWRRQALREGGARPRRHRPAPAPVPSPQASCASPAWPPTKAARTRRSIRSLFPPRPAHRGDPSDQHVQEAGHPAAGPRGAGER